MNSTRVFWDPTYTDPAYTQPNYNPTTKGNCNVPLQAPELILMMQSWVTNDYPGTKTSIDEYNFGGNESINGAVTQADILGIFGAYGLDMAEPINAKYTDQVPAIWPSKSTETMTGINQHLAIPLYLHERQSGNALYLWSSPVLR